MCFLLCPCKVVIKKSLVVNEELGIERRGRYPVPGGITGPTCSWGI
jgi:hypothetical protein